MAGIYRRGNNTKFDWSRVTGPYRREGESVDDCIIRLVKHKSETWPVFAKRLGVTVSSLRGMYRYAEMRRAYAAVVDDDGPRDTINYRARMQEKVRRVGIAGCVAEAERERLTSYRCYS